jgi:large repetitive protein
MDTSFRRHRLTRVVVLAAAAACLTLTAASTALGANVVCGQVLTQSTHVKNDLTNCPADGLVIGAPNIKIDLGHHVIDGTNTPGSRGIQNSGGFDNVKIEHGTIQQFGQGIGFVNVDHGKIEHTTVLNNFDGIHLTGSDFNKISHNDVSANGSSSIVLITGSDNNKVDHNKAHDNPAWGITSDFSAGNTYSHNKVWGNNVAGIEPFHGTNIHVDHNDVHDNHIGIEFFTTSNSFVTKNKIRSNTLDGLHTFTGSIGNQIRDNHADKNGADGLDVLDAGNTITKNHADENTNLGIFAAPGNIDGGKNKAHKNGNPLQCVGVVCK